MIRTTLLAVMLVGCGRAELQGPPAEAEGLSSPVTPGAAPACVVVDDFRSSRWNCETVSALEIVSLKVTNSDGSTPWSAGQPVVRAVMRNTTGEFLNYPGVHIGTSAPTLEPTFQRDSLYGMSGCQDAEMGMGFSGTVPSGTQVTFTAFPAYINGDQCPLTAPPVKVTVTAP